MKSGEPSGAEQTSSRGVCFEIQVSTPIFVGRGWGPRLARMVLSRLEAKPIEEVMVWEVLMAVDWMAHDLTAEKDRQRMVQFVKRMEQRGTRSGLLAFKIDDTLYCDLHLGQPREEESTCGAR